MKIKIVVVDFEMPARVRRWAVGLAIPAVILGTVGIVLAASDPPAPKTWAKNDLLTAEDLNASFRAVAIPVGSISAFGGQIDGNPGDVMTDGKAPKHLPPSGWLLCNGKLLNGLAPEYAALYAAIGTAFGGNASAQSFNLPDLQGRFLRGLDGSKDQDPDGAKRIASAPGGNVGELVGSLQDDAIEEHTHAIDDPGHHHRVWDAFGLSWAWNSNGSWGSHDFVQTTAVLDTKDAKTNITGTLPNAGEAKDTRPKNVAVNYIIKY